MIGPDLMLRVIVPRRTGPVIHFQPLYAGMDPPHQNDGEDVVSASAGALWKYSATFYIDLIQAR
ncbi:hypothetical protein ACFS07_02135 [Undibacterium arcticum]